MNRKLPLVVCPTCRYGFLDRETTGNTFHCPRRECGYEWDSTSETAAAVHGSQRRKARPELHLTAGASPARCDLPEGETVLGRDPTSPFLLESRTVSRRHARFVRNGDEVTVEDLGSAYGTFVNSAPATGPTRLSPGDELLIGGATIVYAVRFEADASTQSHVDHPDFIAHGATSAPKVKGTSADAIPLTGRRLTFGRAPDRDVVLPHAMISLKHALLEARDGGHLLSDTGSRTGTFVNGKAIIRAKLEPGDRVQFGPFLFRFEGDTLRRVIQVSSLGVLASRLTQKAGAITLVDDVSLVFQPGEFVGLLGPSGAGKSTLLDALNGMRPAKSGRVLINGEPLYQQYERLRHLIGYVPQDDIIHAELTSRQALTYAGRLRLPPDATAGELAKLVVETLDALDLTPRADVLIRRLSGGQRKRASVGVELLSKPGILFLDEPTSGLDPATESRLMRKFRQLADQGRTVVCTTHVMENVDLFDKVVVLAPGGRLAYFGPPLEAKSYFGIAKFTLLYDRLEEKSPPDWQKQYRESALGRELLAPAMGGGDGAAIPKRPTAAAPASSALGQWSVLTRRFAAILRSDKPNLVLLAAQPLVIAGLIALVCREMPLIFFLLVVAALWFGCSTAAQQIVKERSIYRRERMVNLRLDCYVLSKFPLLALISVAQCLLMLGIIWLCRGREGDPVIQVAALTLASWCGVALGLIISALASNADKAMAVVPLVLMPQIVLAGALVALPDMNAPTRFASHLMASKWANQALDIGLLEGRNIDRDLLERQGYLGPLWNLFPDDDLDTDEGRIRFLGKKTGVTIQKRDVLALDFSALVVLVVAQLTAVGVVLGKQDVL